MTVTSWTDFGGLGVKITSGRVSMAAAALTSISLTGPTTPSRSDHTGAGDAEVADQRSWCQGIEIGEGEDQSGRGSGVDAGVDACPVGQLVIQVSTVGPAEYLIGDPPGDAFTANHDWIRRLGRDRVVVVDGQAAAATDVSQAVPNRHRCVEAAVIELDPAGLPTDVTIGRLRGRDIDGGNDSRWDRIG